MTKNTWTLSLLAIGVAAGPVLAGGMSAGLGSDIPNVKPVPPVESALPKLTVVPESAAKTDVQAMVASQQPIVSVAGDIAKMSGDVASGTGEAIMDRILYIKGTPASGTATPVAGAESAQQASLKPARRGPVGYVLSGPIKVVHATVDYVSNKTKASPFWTSFAFSAANLMGAVKLMVLNGYFRTGAEMSRSRVAAVLGLSLTALLYLGYGMAIDKANTEKETVRKMNESAAKANDSLKAVPGVVGAEGETIPGEKSNDHVIVVKVKQLDAGNINMIPKTIDGFKTRVQFVR